MAKSDFIADFITVIRNASSAGLDKVTIPSSKTTLKIAEILQKEGFIESVKDFSEGNKFFVRIHLKYVQGKQPAIQGLKRISTPGLRHYSGADKITRVRGGLGVAILSTSKGVMTDRDARSQKVGGEILCTVW